MDSIVVDLGLLFMGFIFATGQGKNIRLAGKIMVAVTLFHIATLLY